ncbi:hypothetical protein Zmor_003177 [Zophobas morio]|uniref:RRM domain-containing protein n=1 Tax=Zophobas morio TaxID=2755281 RepID=A0AA38HNL1_9CUCU|nr:hypothetical protein Zmor_003177 [Zophobas morio]
MRNHTPPNYHRLHTVKISNLSYSTSEDTLERIFSRYGSIGYCYIAKNPVTKKSRGFGFVKFYHRSSAIDATYRLNGEVMEGRIMEVSLTDRRLRRSLARRVRRSESSDSNSSEYYSHKYLTLKVENLTYRTDEKDLKDKFYHCGPIADIYVPRIRHTHLNRGFAFIRFYRKYDAIFAIENLDDTRLNGRRIKIREARYGKPPPNRRFAYGSSPMAEKLRKHR